jgi:hypothetical protein
MSILYLFWRQKRYPKKALAGEGACRRKMRLKLKFVYAGTACHFGAGLVFRPFLRFLDAFNSWPENAMPSHGCTCTAARQGFILPVLVLEYY